MADKKQKTELKGKTKEQQKKSTQTQKGREGNALGKENRVRGRRGNTEHPMWRAIARGMGSIYPMYRVWSKEVLLNLKDLLVK